MAKKGQLKISSWWNVEWAIVVWIEEKNARHPIEKCELKKSAQVRSILKLSFFFCIPRIS